MLNTTDMFPGMEAIDYLANPALGDKLTKLFQKVFDYKESLDYKHVIAGGESACRDYRLQMVYDYFSKVISKDFLKVLKDTANLDVRQLYLTGGKDDGVTFCFACDIGISGQYQGMGTIIAHEIGNLEYDSAGVPLTSPIIEDLTHLAECIDLKKGRLTSSKFGRKKNIPLYVPAMYFDVNGAFCGEDFTSTEHYSDPLTAREITAIMLHEIGHAMTVIEHAGDIYVTRARILAEANALKRVKDTSVLKEFLAEFKSKVLNGATAQANALAAKAGKEGSMLRKATGTLNGLVTCIDKLLVEDNTASVGNAIGAFIGNFLARLVWTVLILYVDLILLCLGIFIWTETVDMFVWDRGQFNEKMSDTPANYNRTFLLERWADEFATRLGYGPDLASALRKLGDISWWTLVNPINSRVLNHCAIYAITSSLCIWVMQHISVTYYLDPNGYENDYQRAKRILENTLGIFKDQKMSKALIGTWLRKVEDLESEVQKAKTLGDTEMGKALYNLLSNVANPIGWMKLVYNGRLARDCEVLENRLDAIMNNKLYALSASFKM